MSFHWEDHPEYIDGCMGCKVSTISVSATVLATRESAQLAVKTMNEEKAMSKDLPAYKRLRKQGYQPKSTFGAADLEARATTEFEISTGRVHADPVKLQTTLRMFEDSTGRSAMTPAKASV
jgi:hypothetical protein